MLGAATLYSVNCEFLNCTYGKLGFVFKISLFEFLSKNVRAVILYRLFGPAHNPACHLFSLQESIFKFFIRISWWYRNEVCGDFGLPPFCSLPRRENSLLRLFCRCCPLLAVQLLWFPSCWCICGPCPDQLWSTVAFSMRLARRALTSVLSASSTGWSLGHTSFEGPFVLELLAAGVLHCATVMHAAVVGVFATAVEPTPETSSCRRSWSFLRLPETLTVSVGACRPTARC